MQINFLDYSQIPASVISLSVKNSQFKG